MTQHIQTIPVSTDISSETIEQKCDKLISNLPKFILGDFSQFSNMFPMPHHQCTAMAAVALATASFKCVISWNSYDLNRIIRAGQIYYENCISYQNVLNSDYNETFIEALNLLQ